MKILCVDNQSAVLDNLVRELNSIVPDASVWPFRDTTTALEFVEENSCDVLFCEIDLYNNDGIMFAEKVQRLNPRVNIIFVTIYEEGERAKDVIRLRPSGYITKPYTRDQLIKELKNLRYPDAQVQIITKPVESVFSQKPKRMDYDIDGYDDYDDYDTKEPLKEETVAEVVDAKTDAKTQLFSTKELRKLGRSELLEMLIVQTKENEKLSGQLEEIEKELASKKLKIANAGSIAEAALSMSGIFEAAQKAADQYLDNVRDKTLELNRMELEATRRAEAIVSEATTLCDKLMRETEVKCEEMKRKAKLETEEAWEELRRRTAGYLEQHEALRALMGKYI